jgi:aryl-alcohol dehydrogenase-like predicted oxidoreductase
LALAWVIKFKSTSTALVGARNVVQLEDSLKSLEVVAKLTPEVEARVNKILGTTPDPVINFLQWKAYDPIRPVAK